MRRARRGSMGRRSRALSYVLVAVIAFSLGGASRASAETGGLTQLVTQVQAFAAVLADEATARKLYQTANDLRQAAHDHALAAQDLWNQKHDAMSAADRERQAAHELNDEAQRLQQAEALRATAFADRAYADSKFADPARQLEIDSLKAEADNERNRAAAAEGALAAQILIVAAKAAEADA